jgi:putative SOS response-associated peptidase YedK
MEIARRRTSIELHYADLRPQWRNDELHDRMPVILDEADWPKWLGEAPASEDELVALLKPSPDASLKIWPVGKMVGNVKNNGPHLQFRAATSAAVEESAALPL